MLMDKFTELNEKYNAFNFYEERIEENFLEFTLEELGMPSAKWLYEQTLNISNDIKTVLPVLKGTHLELLRVICTPYVYGYDVVDVDDAVDIVDVQVAPTLIRSRGWSINSESKILNLSDLSKYNLLQMSEVIENFNS